MSWSALPEFFWGCVLDDINQWAASWASIISLDQTDFCYYLASNRYISSLVFAYVVPSRGTPFLLLPSFEARSWTGVLERQKGVVVQGNACQRLALKIHEPRHLFWYLYGPGATQRYPGFCGSNLWIRLLWGKCVPLKKSSRGSFSREGGTVWRRRS